MKFLWGLASILKRLSMSTGAGVVCTCVGGAELHSIFLEVRDEVKSVPSPSKIMRVPKRHG